MSKKAFLVLEDGSVHEGNCFGAEADAPEFIDDLRFHHYFLRIASLIDWKG